MAIIRRVQSPANNGKEAFRTPFSSWQTSPWPRGKCVRFGAGKSRVRLSARSYQDLVNWYCGLLTRRTVCGKSCRELTQNIKTSQVKMKPKIVQTQSWRYMTMVVIKRQQQTTFRKRGFPNAFQQSTLMDRLLLAESRTRFLIWNLTLVVSKQNWLNCAQKRENQISLLNSGLKNITYYFMVYPQRLPMRPLNRVKMLVVNFWRTLYDFLSLILPRFHLPISIVCQSIIQHFSQVVQVILSLQQ